MWTESLSSDVMNVCIKLTINTDHFKNSRKRWHRHRIPCVLRFCQFPLYLLSYLQEHIAAWGPCPRSAGQEMFRFWWNFEVQYPETLNFVSGQSNDCDVLLCDAVFFGTYLTNFMTSHPRDNNITVFTRVPPWSYYDYVQSIPHIHVIFFCFVLILSYPLRLVLTK